MSPAYLPWRPWPSLCPQIKWSGAYCFCPVCFVNFDIRYNFWTESDRGFIFGMHTQLMMPFQLTPRLMTLWPWLWPFSDSCRQGHSVSQTHLDFFCVESYHEDNAKPSIPMTLIFDLWHWKSERFILSSWASYVQ